MSHHLDSPIARQDPRLDITDLYVFRGETGTVFAMDVCHSKAGDLPVPGYHPEGKYEFKIDLNGDTQEEVTYRFTFGDRSTADTQSVELRRLTGADASDPHAAGTVIAMGSTDDVLSANDGTRAWAGMAGDPFWIEPDVLHAVGHAFQDGTIVDLTSGIRARPPTSSPGTTSTPSCSKSRMARLDQHGREWADRSLGPRQPADGCRGLALHKPLGLPMIHPLFTQYNEDLGDRLNGGVPSTDFEMFGETVINEIAGVVTAYGTAEDPRALRRVGRSSLFAQHPSLPGRNTSGVRVRHMERAVTHR